MNKTTQSLVKVSVNSPQSLANFANVLKKFIVERKLYTEIQKKNYVHVEAWEFAGACMGIYPVVREVLDVSKEGEIKYKARVELIVMSSGKVIGAGEAICSDKETKGGRKVRSDEYAIASMAQTRATGKAYRNSFAWIMKMAGYETTPAEEAQYMPVEQEPEVLLDAIDTVKERVNAKLDTMTSVERIKAVKNTGKINTKNFTESNWRRLDMDLGTDKQGGENDVEKLDQETGADL